MNDVHIVEHLRGRKLLDSSELQGNLSEASEYGAATIHWGPFRLPFEAATHHFCAVGAHGTGKTLLMRLLMQSVLPYIGTDWKAAIQKEKVISQDLQRETFENAQSVLDRTTRAQKIATPKTEVIPARPVAYQLPRSRTAAIVFGAGSSAWAFWASSSTPSLQMGATVGSFLCLFMMLSLTWKHAGTKPERHLGQLTGPFIVVLLGIILTFAVASDSPISRTLIASVALSLGGVFVLWGVANYVTSGAGEPKTVEIKPKDIPSAVQPTAPKEPLGPTYRGPREWDGHRALIYDAKLEVLPQLKAMGLLSEPIILNPFDKRSSAWDIAKDVTEPATAQQIAAILFPEDSKDSQRFFQDAGRNLIYGVMVALMHVKPERWTLRDVLLAFRSHATLGKLLNQTDHTKHLVSQYLEEPRTAQNILSSVATKLNIYEPVVALWEHADSKQSLNDWLNSESILVLSR